MTEHLLMYAAMGIGCSALGAIIGIIWGYELGTRDTTRRWSEAVSRANYQREIERMVKS
jgi:hypothetical protein